MIAPLLVLSLLPLPQDPPAAAPQPAQPPQPAEQAQTAQPRIEWQRSLGDALAVQQATGLPILVCVNTEGENFNDQFAGRVYRDAGFVADTQGYVCLIASPERHRDADHDVDGNRLECPRFPGVTCGEHMRVEPAVFERWFHGQRAAPRHVGVDQDGKVLFDRFLDGSMQTAIDAIRRHKGAAAAAPLPATAAGLLQRREAAARRALEAIWTEGDQPSRLALLAAAATAGNEPFDLLRPALRGSDAALFAAGCKALAATATPAARAEIDDALARLDDGELRRALLQRLEQLGQQDPGCRRAAAWQRAAAKALQRLQEPAWRQLLAAPAVATTVERDAAEQRADRAERACRQQPDDGQTRLELALANLQLAELAAARRDSLTEAMFADAARAAERAERLLGDDPRRGEAQAVQAVVLWQRGESAPAAALAQRALAQMQEPGAELFAKALRVAAAGDRAQLQALPKDGDDDGQALVEHAVGEAALLAAHPCGSEADRAEAARLLVFVGARRQAQQLLLQTVARHPTSPAVHELLRARIIQDLGGEALLQQYRGLVAKAEDRPTMQWFAGYAAIVVAELAVKDQRPPAAEAAYTASIDGFAAAAANPDFADSANHFAVLARAGRALLRHGRGDVAGTVADFAAAAALRPASLNELDGLGRKPIAILRRVQQELRAKGQVEAADQLRELDR